MGSDIVYGRSRGSIFDLYHDCSINEDQTQATCKNASGNPLSLPMTCDAGGSCQVADHFQIKSNDDGAYLLLDLSLIHIAKQVRNVPNDASAVIADVTYKKPYKSDMHEDVTKEVKHFPSKTAYEIWFAKHKDNVESIQLTALVAKPAPNLPSLRFETVGQLKTIFSAPEAFVIIQSTSNPKVLAAYGSASKAATFMKGNPGDSSNGVILLHMQNDVNGKKVPKLIAGESWQLLARYAKWASDIHKSFIVTDTYTKSERSGGNFLKWDFRFGPGFMFNLDWVQKALYHEAAAKLVNPAFRGDVQKMLLDPNVSDQMCAGPFNMCGLSLGFIFYLGQDFLGFGPMLDHFTNSKLKITNLDFHLEWSILNTFLDNPVVDIAPYGRIGGTFIGGEAKAPQLYSYEDDISGQGWHWSVGGSLPIRLFSFGDTGAMKLIPSYQYMRAYNKLEPRFDENAGNFHAHAFMVYLSLGQERKPFKDLQHYKANYGPNPYKPNLIRQDRPLDGTDWKQKNLTFGLDAMDPVEKVATGPMTPVTPDELGPATPSGSADLDTITNDSPGQFPVGERWITWTATSTDGQTATVKQKVTIIDGPPELVPPPTVTKIAPDKNALTKLSPDELGLPEKSWDAVDGDIQATNDAPAAGFPLGETTVTWKAVDSAGNEVTATQKVVITEKDGPQAFAKIPLPDLKAIEFTKQMEFVVAKVVPVDGPKGIGVIDEMIAETKSEIEKAYPLSEYPHGVPQGSVLKMTFIGHASPEGKQSSNQSLSAGRAPTVASLMSEKMKQLKTQGIEPFSKLEFNEDHFHSFGRGESEPLDTYGLPVSKPFGGFENDGANKKGDTYQLCVGSSKAKMNVGRNCAPDKIVTIDLPGSRRVVVKVEVYPPGTKIEKPSYQDISQSEREADAVLANKVIDKLHKTKWYRRTKGIKRFYYSKADNTFHMVIDKKGFESNLGKIQKGFIRELNKAQRKLKSQFSSGCTLKVWLFYKNRPQSDDHYIGRLKSDFFKFGMWQGRFDVGLKNKTYKKSTAIAALKQEVAKQQQALGEMLNKQKIELGGGYSAIAIPVKDPSDLNLAEFAAINAATKRFKGQGKEMSLYINFNGGFSESSAVSIANSIRSTYPKLANVFTTTDTRYGSYVVIVAGDQAIDLEANEQTDMRQKIFDDLMK